ncbi:MAG: hypothetical protein JNM10_04495 [Planctomycetia bacterium]|nr:hypothetical protein [Planctomycetia bacterium]
MPLNRSWAGVVGALGLLAAFAPAWTSAGDAESGAKQHDLANVRVRRARVATTAAEATAVLADLTKVAMDSSAPAGDRIDSILLMPDVAPAQAAEFCVEHLTLKLPVGDFDSLRDLEKGAPCERVLERLGYAAVPALVKWLVSGERDESSVLTAARIFGRVMGVSVAKKWVHAVVEAEMGFPQRPRLEVLMQAIDALR